MAKHTYSRRQFLGSMPCLALGTTTLFSSLVNLRAMDVLMGSTSGLNDYKAMVCVLLNGGNDSFNMIIPTDSGSYAEYQGARSNMALGQNTLLPIDPLDGSGRSFGLHPNMMGLQSLFASGKVAFVNNVGTLIEPVSKSGYFNNTANLPLGLLSHVDQVMHWQTGIPQDRQSIGWGGKMADMLQTLNPSNDVSMNISLSGNNVFQRGNEVVEYAINNDGAVAINGWNGNHPFLRLMTEDISDMMNKSYEDVFKDAYTGILRRSVESNEVFNVALDTTDSLEDQFTAGNPLSQDLRMIARTISAREELGAKRQIFFVQLGGFDNHDELINNHGLLMQTVDQAMSEFYQATDRMGIAENVTTFTISDFSRTLSSNGNGTDHAWGGNAIVMGGAVRGQRMYGDFPALSDNSDLNLGRGILIPTMSADEYLSEIALWFGVSPNDLHLLFPNIGNFYDVASGVAPVGFLA